ncbi:MAG: hypothetical protein WD872_19540 [Pirellulaceae bacterium]
MPPAKPFNPFFVLLLVVGTAFALTACAYCAMTVRGQNAAAADEGGLIGLMDQYGLTILVTELVLLGVLTFAAIGTDEFWTRRFKAAAHSQQDSGEPPPR